MTPSNAAPGRNLLRIYFEEAKYEFLKNLRLPIYTASTLLFPVMFYVFFGLTFAQGSFGSVSQALYYAVAYGAFGVMGAALFGFGVTVAVERGQGWMRVKRASPMPPLAYFVAKVLMAMLFGLIITVTLLTLAVVVGGARPDPVDLLVIVAVMVGGAIPFSAMGLAFGYLAGPNSAAAVVNLVYLPLAFAGGLWIPIEALPAFLQALAPWLPSYHFAQLALSVLGVDQGGTALGHLGVLALYTCAFLALAVALYRRDEGRTYG